MDAGSGSDTGSGSDSGSGSGSASPPPPAGSFTIDASSFYNDGTRWWTTASGPVLTGTIQTTGGMLQAFIGGQPLASAGITGSSWSLTLPQGTILPAGTTVALELTAPGATMVEHDQLISLDNGAPAIATTAPFHDERNDTISFSTGDAVHTHAAATIDLATGCPDVYKYAYLTDATPRYATESSPNPIAYQVSAMSAVGIESTQYRVRTATSTALDWAPVTSGSIVLHRDALPQLGSYEGDLYVDVDVKDHLGVDASQTYCMHYHPLAAPLEIKSIAKETTGGPLWPMQLANHDPVSRVLMPNIASPVIGERFIQHAAESVTLDLALDAPTASYSKTVADNYVKVATSTSPINCGIGRTSTDLRCKTPSIINSGGSSNGTIMTGIWTIAVIDEATSATTCTVSGLNAACTIPARAAGEAAHSYRIVASVDGITDLAPCPQAGWWGEEALATGVQYTGTPYTSVFHCDSTTTDSAGQVWCNYSGYNHYCGLEAAKLSFDPFTVHYATSVNATIPERDVPVAASAAMTWDAGSVSLP